MAVITGDDGAGRVFATVDELVDYILELKEWPPEDFNPCKSWFG